MSKKIILTIPFNNRPWSDKRLTKEWIDNRLQQFFKYSYPSFIAQTNQDFTAIVLFDIQSMDYITKQLCYYPTLPSNIIFTDETAGYNLIKLIISYYDQYYEVHFDSDNAMNTTYIERLHAFKPKEDTEALLTAHTYFYDAVYETMYYWSHPALTCYSLIYNSKDYLAGKRYHYYEPILHSSLNSEVISGYNHLTTLHGFNKFFNENIKCHIEVPKERQQELLATFHLFGLPTKK